MRFYFGGGVVRRPTLVLSFIYVGTLAESELFYAQFDGYFLCKNKRNLENTLLWKRFAK